MKHVSIMFVVIGVLCVSSCRMHKMSTETDNSLGLMIVDTTKVLYDSTMHQTLLIDTSRTDINYSTKDIIEFVDGGGKINVDNDGRIILEGVKNIKSESKGEIDQCNGATNQVEDITLRTNQVNGIDVTHNEYERRADKNECKRRWYETAFIRIGQAVCLAALLWLMFLYLRRKL